MTLFRRRFWLPAVKAAGLDGLRVHDLRHTAVALLIAAGPTPRRYRARTCDLVVVGDRTTGRRAAETARELLDQCP